MSPPTDDSQNLKRRSSAGSGSEELSVFVEEMLESMNRKFQSVEQSIQSKLSVMGTQMDELEGSIEDLLQQAGLTNKDDSINENDTVASGTSRKSTGSNKYANKSKSSHHAPAPLLSNNSGVC